MILKSVTFTNDTDSPPRAPPQPLQKSLRRAAFAQEGHRTRTQSLLTRCEGGVCVVRRASLDENMLAARRTGALRTVARQHVRAMASGTWIEKPLGYDT